MRAIIKSYGTKLNGAYGVTGELISDFTKEQLLAHMDQAVAYKFKVDGDPFYSIAIVVERQNMPEVKKIMDCLENPLATITCREPMSFEQV